MKYAVFSDVHANLEALEAVLEHAESIGCNNYACLGDTVGYNSNPIECLNLVRHINCPVIKGNIDELASQPLTLEGLNPIAKKAIEWTRDQLDNEHKSWLRSLELVKQVDSFMVVHASLDTPGNWVYITNKFDAMASMSYQLTPLCFNGHTHIPVAYETGDSTKVVDTFLPETKVSIDPNKRYLVNVGSVGHPRDGDWRACYVEYDTSESYLRQHRVEYDIVRTQKKLKRLNLPPSI